MKAIIVILAFLSTVLFISAHFILQLYYLVESTYLFGICINAFIVDIIFIPAVILQGALLWIIVESEIKNDKK